MKPVAALVAITFALLAGPLTGTAVAASPDRVPAQPPAAGLLRLDLTQVSPRVVTADGPDALSVIGTLTNTGTEPVDELEIRVQRSNPLRTEGQLRDALDGTAETDAVTPQFTPLPGVLAPGGQREVRLSVPLRGAPQTGLALGATGVHELLVNVNGVPDGGDRARLAATRMLLPVLSLPATGSADPVLAEPTPATPFAMLYPITEAPRRLSTVLTETTLLADDDLAASLAPDGRLGGLLSALTAGAPAGSAVRRALCVALDPDLVETVAAMSAGPYDVRGPGGERVPGTGTEVATAWLTQLREVTAEGCVFALPYADADLVALTRGGQGELATRAITDGRETLARILGVPTVTDVTWPAAGLLDGPTLDRVVAAGGRSLLLAADGVEQPRTARSDGILPIATGGATVAAPTAVLTDPLLSAALAPPTASVGDTVAAPGGAASATGLAGDGGPLATQDGIGALAFRVTGEQATEADADGPLVLAPPHSWGSAGPAARALLDSVEELIDSGLLVPDANQAVTPGAPAGPPVPTAYPIGAVGTEVAPATIGAVTATTASVLDLRSAARPGSPNGVTPDEVFAPLLRGVVRPASAAFRGRPDEAARAAGAATDRIGELRATVRVLEPPSPYSLGTENVPIPITLGNGLPVTMEVRLEIAPSPGLKVAPIEPQQIPPLGRRQVTVSAEVTRAGQFTVQASVSTPGGEQLGPPSRLRMRSTAYGTITLWLTGSAAVLLVVLVARRVVRRIRGQAESRRGTAPEATGPLTDGRAPPDPADPLTGDPFPDPTSITVTLPAGPDPATERLPAGTDPSTERLPSARPRPTPRPVPQQAPLPTPDAQPTTRPEGRPPEPWVGRR